MGNTHIVRVFKMEDRTDKELNFLCYCASNLILKKIYKNEELNCDDIHVLTILLEEYRELLYKFFLK